MSRQLRVLIGCERSGIVRNASPGPERDRIRSRFYPGLADAMADQWGGWAMEQEAAA